MEKEANSKLKILTNITFIILAAFLIFAAIFVRTKLFLTNIPFDFDESMLSLSFFKTKLLGFFHAIGYAVKVPPLWSILTQIGVKCFGLSYMNFRLVSYVSSIISIFAFFILLKNIFNNKLAILLGLTLFAVNFPLIYYSNDFRPYSSDVLVSVLFILSYKYISLKDLTAKKCILYTVASVLFILFSFPAILIIPSIILAKCIEEKKFNFKTLFIIAGVLAALLYLYYIDKNMYNYMNGYWSQTEKGFLSFHLVSISNIFKDLYNFIFLSSKAVPLLMIISLFGLINLFKIQRNYGYISLFILLFAIIGSFLHLYPFARRLILYLIPLMIIWISSALEDSEKYFSYNTFKNLIIFITILFITNVHFTNMFNSHYLDNYYWTSGSYDKRREAHKTIITFLNNIQNNDLLLLTCEMQAMLPAYNTINKINKKPEITNIPYYVGHDITLMQNFIKDYVMKKPKSKVLYIISMKQSFNVEPSFEFYESLFNSLNLQYEKYTNKYMFIYKVY